MSVTWLPSFWNACASSRPTGPAPTMIMRRGISLVVGASRFVHTPSTSSSPSIGGSNGSEPPDRITALRASSSSSPTVTRRSPVSRPRPRTSAIRWLCTHGIRKASSGSPVCSSTPITSSRRASTAATFGPPFRLSGAPRIRPAPARTSGGRSSAFDGMHAQCPHSPPTSRSSTSATLMPRSEGRAAASSPVGPPPTTTTSNVLIDRSLRPGAARNIAATNDRTGSDDQRSADSCTIANRDGDRTAIRLCGRATRAWLAQPVAMRTTITTRPDAGLPGVLHYSSTPAPGRGRNGRGRSCPWLAR